MTDPKRWLDSGDAPQAALSLVSQLRAPLPLSPAKEMELARQLASLTAPALGGAPAATASAWVKAALLCVVVGMAGAGIVAALLIPGSTTRGAHETSDAHPIAAPPASAAAPLEEVAQPALDVAPAAPVEPSSSASAPPAPSARAKSPAHDTLADEEELLEQARRAASSSPAAAMNLLQQHQRRFPAGQLTAERMFLSVDVLTRMGDVKGARRQADALVRLFPSSAYATQIKARGQ